MNKRKRSVKPQNPHTENKDNFKFIWLGQTILKYQVPLDIFNHKLPTHFNESGYKLVAEHINNFISK